MFGKCIENQSYNSNPKSEYQKFYESSLYFIFHEHLNGFRIPFRFQFLHTLF